MGKWREKEGPENTVRAVVPCEQIHASRMTGGGRRRRRGFSSAGLFDFLIMRLDAESIGALWSWLEKDRAVVSITFGIAVGISMGGHVGWASRSSLRMIGTYFYHGFLAGWGYA